MPRPSKDLTRENTFRHTEAERLVLEQEQKRFAEYGLTLSLNDVIRALVRRAAIPVPVSQRDAQRLVDDHCSRCPECAVGGGPRCPDGLYLRDCFTRVRATARATAPASAWAPTSKLKSESMN